jgi:tyrosine-protein phosphatase YwqE
MVTWFHKKKFVADYLEGLVDIHNHILPGIDDGAKTVEESIALIKAFDELGMQHFIATPHIFPALYPNNSETIRKAHQQLMEALLEQRMTQVSIVPSAEHMIDDSFDELLSQEGVMPLKDGFLLVEMSYLQPSLNFNEAIVQITQKGLTPVLAHPERYMYLHQTPYKYREYKQKGILFQLNMLSLGPYYGKDVQKMARQLLEDGMIDFIGTDTHSLKHLKAISEIQIKEKEADRLLPVIQNTISTFY